MAASGIDWTAIRQQYEQGMSKNTLAKEHGVSRQAIQQRAAKEHWITPLLASPTAFLAPMQVQTTDELSELSIVEKALKDLAQHLEHAPLDLKSHKLFADALSQYIKLRLLLPQQQSEDGQESYGLYDLREFLASCTDEELAIVRPVIAAVQIRKQEQEDGKIKPMRKIG